jgi:hypothetical protein
MLTPSTGALMIRMADPTDATRLADLAALDSAQPLGGSALVAEVGGEPVAALEVGSGRAVADPFRRTQRILDLLRLRATQLQ